MGETLPRTAKLREIQRRRDTIAVELAQLDEREAAVNEPIRRAASIMHGAFCHGEGCGWQDENESLEPWTEPTHERWIEVTVKLLDEDGFQEEQLVRFAEVVADQTADNLARRTS